MPSCFFLHIWVSACCSLFILTTHSDWPNIWKKMFKSGVLYIFWLLPLLGLWRQYPEDWVNEKKIEVKRVCVVEKQSEKASLFSASISRSLSSQSGCQNLQFQIFTCCQHRDPFQENKPPKCQQQCCTETKHAMRRERCVQNTDPSQSGHQVTLQL